METTEQEDGWVPHTVRINPLNTELNPICHLLALLGAHPILHISRIRVKDAVLTGTLITLLTYIWEVHGSNLHNVSCYHDLPSNEIVTDLHLSTFLYNLLTSSSSILSSRRRQQILSEY